MKETAGARASERGGVSQSPGQWQWQSALRIISTSDMKHDKAIGARGTENAGEWERDGATTDGRQEEEGIGSGRERPRAKTRTGDGVKLRLLKRKEYKANQSSLGTESSGTLSGNLLSTLCFNNYFLLNEKSLIEEELRPIRLKMVDDSYSVKTIAIGQLIRPTERVETNDVSEPSLKT